MRQEGWLLREEDGVGYDSQMSFTHRDVVMEGRGKTVNKWCLVFLSAGREETEVRSKCVVVLSSLSQLSRGKGR